MPPAVTKDICVVQTPSMTEVDPSTVPSDSEGLSSSDTTDDGKKRSPFSQMRELPRLTRREVLEKSDRESLCLIIVDDKIYDCTKWQYAHPGGHLTVRALCGKDATDNFRATHPKDTERKWLHRFHYGNLALTKEEEEYLRKETPAKRATMDFCALTKRMEDAGMFETDYSFYFVKATWLFTLLFVALRWTLSDERRDRFFGAAMLGLFWQQTAFVGHDLGHNGITHDRITDSVLGLVFGNFLTGIGIGWWKRGHNVHHIVTNSRDHDPDIQHLPVFAVDPDFLYRRIFSTWFDRHLDLNAAAHFLVRIQHLLFYPVMAFARYNLYAQSLMHAAGVGLYSNKRETLWRRNLQLATLLGFVGWLSLLVSTLDGFVERLLYLTIAHAVGGILHVQITISHFPMPSYAGTTYDDDTNGFLFTQTAGTMDVDCSVWTDWFHGGLQFQTVHHLWPRMPRHNLRAASRILQRFCDEHDGLEYHKADFFKANVMLLSTLRRTAKTAASWSELFAEGFHLVG